jgi:hypothetical protein
MQKIKFTNITNLEAVKKPEPASRLVPEWYKKTESYIDGVKTPPKADLNTAATIKKCMPVFDALTSGYIIKSPADVWVTLKEGTQFFHWSNFDLISFHPIEQAPFHPEKKPHAYAKWNNPWAIKTPKGYSTLFVQPFHRESVFTILPGIVDTDSYFSAVNFPFVINDPDFEGVIPAGTPIAQIIPFKRDSWKMELGSLSDNKEQADLVEKLKTKFYDRYKTLFWSRKEYK